MMKNFLAIADATGDDLRRIFNAAFDMRRQRHTGQPNAPILAGKTLAMIFEKRSLRTRASFEQAVVELGGHAMVIQNSEVGMGTRESAADVARVFSGMVHGIAARVFEHQTLAELVLHATVPVINMLSNQSHPCQVLADAMTIMDEFGRDLSGKTITFVGDGNNVARSLAWLCAKTGMSFVLASPAGYELDAGFADHLRQHAPNMKLEMTRDPVRAVRNADVVYTDTWVSMGQEDQATQRRAAFSAYQVNTRLLAAAPEHAIVLHCLPASRGCEITETVMEGPRSRVFLEAHNRLHAQKGLLAILLGSDRRPS